MSQTHGSFFFLLALPPDQARTLDLASGNSYSTGSGFRKEIADKFSRRPSRAVTVRLVGHSRQGAAKTAPSLKSSLMPVLTRVDSSPAHDLTRLSIY
jgi:hypothetical protein